MTDRIHCVVPFCRRTASKEKMGGDCEIICGPHWRMISRSTRDRRALAKRCLKRARARFDRQAMRQQGVWTAAQYGRVEAALRLEWALWERCKREAIERAGGIA